MKNNAEQGPKIKFRGSSDLRSVAESNGMHCVEAAVPQEEPLVPFDFRILHLALVDEEIGRIDAQSARQEVKELKKRYDAGDLVEKQRIGEVVTSAFIGLMTKRELERQPALITRNETVLYRRGR